MTVRTIAMVGASPNHTRPSFYAMKYLLTKGYRVLPVNPGAADSLILGQKVYATLSDLLEVVDMVEVFRSSKEAARVTEDAIAHGAKVLWMQLGVRNDSAARQAEKAGLQVVMNRCPKIEFARLSGELSWFGINSQMISSRRTLWKSEDS